MVWDIPSPSRENMTIIKKGKKYVLLSKTTGRVLGTHPSRADAMKQEKAIQISKARATGHNIPKK